MTRIVFELSYLASRSSNTRCRATPATDLDVRFSRIRFLGCTRSRVERNHLMQTPHAVPYVLVAYAAERFP